MDNLKSRLNMREHSGNKKIEVRRSKIHYIYEIFKGEAIQIAKGQEFQELVRKE